MEANKARNETAGDESGSITVSNILRSNDVQCNTDESPQFSFWEEMFQNEGFFQLYLLKASNEPDTKEGKSYAQPCMQT